MRVEGDITIERAAEEVFDFVADERNEPQYNPRMTHAEKISPGPIGVGTRFRSVMTGTGPAVEMTIEYTAYDRPNRLASTTHLSNMDIEGVLLFEPVSDGTRMQWIWDIEPRGLYKLIGPLVQRMGERQERAIWTGLKHLLEAQPHPSRAGAW
jgi:uncharacterized protein YndB with AHSA1/START domain